MNEDQLKLNWMTKRQLIDKYKFLTENMLKNILFKNINNFREACTKKIGKKIVINEFQFLEFIKHQKC